MKHKKKNIILILLLIFITTGCSIKLQEKNNLSNNTKENKQTKDNITNNANEVISSVKIEINKKVYTIDLENNETVDAFVNLLPKELTMNELNGNEKYIYLDEFLPTNASNPKHINIGDVMLYGNNCLVIFYKSFDTSYSYTKIGHIDDLPNLGNDNIQVRILK